MRTLQEADIIRVMREEWEARVKALAEQVNVVMNARIDGSEEPVIVPGLKVRHKNSQLLYTITSVGRDDVILKTSEGDEFLVDAHTLETEYELD